MVCPPSHGKRVPLSSVEPPGLRVQRSDVAEMAFRFVKLLFS